MSTNTYSFPLTLRLKFDDALVFWQKVIDAKFETELVPEKNQLIGLQQDSKHFLFKAPLVTSISKPEVYLQNANKIDAFTVVLMQPGNAAIGYFENGEVVEHKVIRKYMTRKKQGRAQVYHLKTKGKSRAGSRVRLEETIEFFEEIHEKLIKWDIVDKSKRIFYHASPVLWPMLFDINNKLAFEQHDERLIKIPRDVNTPIFDELIRTANFLKTAELVVLQPSILEDKNFAQVIDKVLEYWKV